MLNYVVEAGEIENIDEFFQTLTQQLPEARGDIMTIAEHLRQEGREQGMQQGMQQGKKEGLYEVARTLLARDMPATEIADITHLPIEEIEKL